MKTEELDRIEEYDIRMIRGFTSCSFCEENKTSYRIHHKEAHAIGGFICKDCFEKRFGMTINDARELEKHTEIVNCNHCKKEKLCTLRRNPYRRELLNDDTLYWLCDECFKKLNEW